MNIFVVTCVCVCVDWSSSDKGDAFRTEIKATYSPKRWYLWRRSPDQFLCATIPAGSGAIPGDSAALAEPTAPAPHIWIWSTGRIAARRKPPEVLWERSSGVPLCPSQIPEGLPSDWTRASALRHRRLSILVFIRSYAILNVTFIHMLFSEILTHLVQKQAPSI